MIRSLPLKALHLYVLLSLVVFLCVQSFKSFSVVGPDWIFHHLNDFLTIPIVATLCLYAIWFIKRDKNIRLNIFTILSLVALYSLVFEYYLPQKSYRYTADIWDVVCYILGGECSTSYRKLSRTSFIKVYGFRSELAPIVIRILIISEGAPSLSVTTTRSV